jgi:hypothetical protein
MVALLGGVLTVQTNPTNRRPVYLACPHAIVLEHTPALLTQVAHQIGEASQKYIHLQVQSRTNRRRGRRNEWVRQEPGHSNPTRLAS